MAEIESTKKDSEAANILKMMFKSDCKASISKKDIETITIKELEDYRNSGDPKLNTVLSVFTKSERSRTGDPSTIIYDSIFTADRKIITRSIEYFDRNLEMPLKTSYKIIKKDLSKEEFFSEQEKLLNNGYFKRRII